MRPALGQAADDAEPLLADHCLLGQPQVVLLDCVYGDPDGARTVALVGDSHAAHWFPALQPIAEKHGWQLRPYIKLSCRFLDMSLYSYWYKRMYTECDRWRELVVDRLEELKPDLVIVAFVGDRETSNATDPDPAHQGEAMAHLLGRIPGEQVIVVDTPGSVYNVPACLSRNVGDVRPCETARKTAFGVNPGEVERIAAEATGATLVDFSDRICPWDPCPVVLDGMIVYRDSHHLTATFASTFSAALEAALPDIDRRARPGDAPP